MPGSGDRKQSVGTSGSRRKGSQSSSNSPNPELGARSQIPEGYTPVNNFNSQDVINHFDKTWRANFDNYHQGQGGVSGPSKTDLYKGTETMTWGSKAGSKGVLSTGVDFLQELKRKEQA